MKKRSKEDVFIKKAWGIMIPILFEDKHLLVCIKPRGVLSQDGTGETMPALLSAQCGGIFYPVHRLDREVSGVMVYARTREAAAKLSQLVGDHEKFCKQYLAVAEGILGEKEGVLEDLLFHDRFKNKTYVVDRMRGGVKAAKLSYRVLAEKEGKSLLSIRLYTGRTHQIRVQFSSRGLPLAGDRRYGAAGGGDIALFSASLTFPHPITREIITVSARPEAEGNWQGFSFESRTE